MRHLRLEGVKFGKMISAPELGWMWLLSPGAATQLFNRYVAIESVTGRLTLLVL